MPPVGDQIDAAAQAVRSIRIAAARGDTAGVEAADRELAKPAAELEKLDDGLSAS